MKTQHAKSRRRSLRPKSAPSGGDSLCPCVSREQVALLLPQEQDLVDFLGPLVNASTYGIGCLDHDVSARLCAEQTCTEDRCDQTWCEKYWCYVDPNNCHLKNRKSRMHPLMNLQISYATCYEMDEQNLYPNLSGQTLKVGANSNTGGWKGSYRTPTGHFEGPLEAWGGPIFEFAKEAARTANFTIELVEPPSFLVNKSIEYFNTSSSFDLCIYSAALGFVDFCIAEYNINEIRATSADFLALGSNSLYLVLHSVESNNLQKSWNDFGKNFQNLFLPFEFRVWMLLIFGVIPLMGCLMLVHEYGHPGGLYHQYETVVVTSSQGQFEPNVDGVGSSSQSLFGTKVEDRPIPVYKHLIKSIYVALLAVLQLQYNSGVVTLGAKIHLMGISFLTLTVTAVYTSNLAVMLLKKAREVPISSLSDAIDKRYTFCANRNAMNTALAVNMKLRAHMFAVDPSDEGGDGLPGFNCKACASRTRIFNFLDVEKANSGDRRYCHATISSEEDLFVFQASGFHCNKTVVGEAVAHTTWGIPVNTRVSSELLSLFSILDIDKVYENILDQLEPQLKCGGSKIVVTSDSSFALDLKDLTGIWVISLGLAVVGILAKCFKKLKAGGEENAIPIVQYDQAGRKRSSMIDLFEISNQIKEFEAKHENVISKVEASSMLSSRFQTSVNAESLQRMLGLHSSHDDGNCDDFAGSSERESGISCEDEDDGDEEYSDSDHKDEGSRDQSLEESEE